MKLMESFSSDLLAYFEILLSMTLCDMHRVIFYHSVITYAKEIFLLYSHEREISLKEGVEMTQNE